MDQDVVIASLRALVAVQKQRIRELVARVEFLQKDALQADRDHQHRRQELVTLRAHHEDMSRRLDAIMQRTR